MSSIISTFSAKNSLSAIGNYRIVSFNSFFERLTAITDYTDVITGETADVIVQRAMRWSKDGDSWSLWIDYSLTDKTPITSLVFDPATPTLIELKYKLVNSPASSPTLEDGTNVSPDIYLEQFELSFDTQSIATGGGEFKPITRCTDEFCSMPVILQSNFTFDPYAVNKSMCLYKDLSKMVNNLFGHEVFYWRITPQNRSQDIVFKEWTLFNVSQHKCIKVLVPNNEFPDNKPNYNITGIDFEAPFEIQIDKAFFESFFGKNAMPQTRDIIYFPLLNRLYEVGSSYLFRDFMMQPIYFKVALIKYQPKADQLMSEDITDTFDSITLTTEKLFGEQMDEQIQRVTKPQQYVTITHEQDPIRGLYNRKLEAVRYDFYNNWTLIGEYYYDMNALYNMENQSVMAVQWKPTVKVGAKESRSFSCWFQPQPFATNVNRNLFSGTSGTAGYKIDLNYVPNGASQIIFTYNNTSYTFSLAGSNINEDEWYGLFVNFSNEFSQVGMYLLGMQANTSDLKILKKEVKSFTPNEIDLETKYWIDSSPLFITNIRLFDAMVEEEHMSLVLNQMIVKDSHKAIIIDNARPLLRLPKLANPK